MKALSDKIGSVLVIGGGIGGMQASLDLADSGFRVYLLEKDTAIGGRMAMLDKTFPTNDCAMCTIAPRLVGTARHHNIHMLSYSELVSVEGDEGHFYVKILKKTRYIDEYKCTGCGICAEHCPVEAIDRYNLGLIRQSGVYLSYPQAIPRIFTINREKCIGCGVCANLCGTGAVNYSL
ncbi:MAG: 4Fe-4S binding protein, partial [Fidelibacterota bacterium]